MDDWKMSVNAPLYAMFIVMGIFAVPIGLLIWLLW